MVSATAARIWFKSVNFACWVDVMFKIENLKSVSISIQLQQFFFFFSNLIINYIIKIFCKFNIFLAKNLIKNYQNLIDIKF